jgi:hypothetical protein
VHMFAMPCKTTCSRTWLFLSNDSFSLANYNDWPEWRESNSHSFCTVHVLRFMGGDGGESKQCTPDALNTDRGLPLGMLF